MSAATSDLSDLSDLSDRARRSRTRWRWVDSVRPEFAVAPGPGRESVWDHPRPPGVPASSGRR